MNQKVKTAITPTREENYSEWYQQVLRAADLAEHSPVRGCMIIKPWGYAIWENIQRILDGQFKATGHQNVYLPLFIPLSYLEKEAQLVEGFAKECAVVTHHRLEVGKEGKLIPTGPLDEPLIVRPTSETMFGEMAAQWVKSYRDLPLLLNQWCNVVRWEMRTRLFLRTAEFLWQEGHTVHATQEEALEETRKMIDLYETFCRTYLAMPFIKGEKTESERFPGAVSTLTIEGMMQDRKALQAGTSHFLGQNFAQAYKIRFRDADGGEKFAWTTSWAVTTRLIGALVMTHSDDDGLVLPPRIASTHVVIIPVMHKEESRGKVLDYCRALANRLREISYHGQPLGVIVDEREMTGGEKLWSWVKKGVPIRLEVGPRDIEKDAVMVGKRNQGAKATQSLPREVVVQEITTLLDEIQTDLYEKALEFRNSHIKKIDTKEEFYAFFTPKDKDQPEIHGGFALSHWSGEKEVEEQVKKDLSVTIRCIPFDGEKEEGRCVITNKKSQRRVIFAKSY
jgi:prolyl-tRNA synthetase